jgi:hypothetical protein
MRKMKTTNWKKKKKKKKEGQQHLEEWVGELQVPSRDCVARLVVGDDALLSHRQHLVLLLQAANHALWG